MNTKLKAVSKTEFESLIFGDAYRMRMAYIATGKKASNQLESEWLKKATENVSKVYRIKMESVRNISLCTDSKLITKYEELCEWSESDGHFTGSNGDDYQIKIHVKNLSDERRKKAKKESK